MSINTIKHVLEKKENEEKKIFFSILYRWKFNYSNLFFPFEV